jgi:hypothetical protein
MCLALNFDSLRLREHVLFARSLTAAMLLVSVTLGCGKEEGATEAAGKSEQSSAEPLDAALAAELNRAVGMMGRFEFEQAATEFARIAMSPNAVTRLRS